MKIIKCGVCCQYWNSNRYFEIEVPDDATDKEIQEELFQMALQEASFDCWIEEPSDVE